LKISSVVVSSLLLGLASWAQTPSLDASLTANPVYKLNCAKCHSKTAEGRHFGGPSLFAAAAMPDDDLRKMITDGKGRMPKYGTKLTSQQIDELVQQIKALKK
jgi:mono/diheme cytochrome c family protein